MLGEECKELETALGPSLLTVCCLYLVDWNRDWTWDWTHRNLRLCSLILVH